MNRIPLLLALALVVAACQSAPEPPPPPPAPMQDSVEEVTAAIEAAYVIMGQGMAGGDIGAMVRALYTPDAIFHPPQAGPVEGHEAIAAAFQGILDAGLKVVPRPVYVDVFGDVAFEYGNGDLTFPDGSETTDTYVVLWKKVNGEWKMHRDFVSGTTP